MEIPSRGGERKSTSRRIRDVLSRASATMDLSSLGWLSSLSGKSRRKRTGERKKSRAAKRERILEELFLKKSAFRPGEPRRTNKGAWSTLIAPPLRVADLVHKEDPVGH